MYDWNQYINRDNYDPADLTKEWWDYQKQLYPAVFNVEHVSLGQEDRLNPEQRLVYDTFMDHYRQTLAGESPAQLLVNVDGQGGSGKSFVVRVLSSHMEQITPPGQPTPIRRLAPTGVAAANIDGATFHSVLRLAIQVSTFSPLNATSLSHIQASLRHVRYLVIDEKSMVGLGVMGWIDFRLRQIFPHNAHMVFGGLSCILLGDFWQLPLVYPQAAA